MVGVVKVFPVFRIEPPEDQEYQSATRPEPTTADKPTVPAPQRLPATTVGAAGKGLTVAVTATLGEETQPVAEFLATT